MKLILLLIMLIRLDFALAQTPYLSDSDTICLTVRQVRVAEHKAIENFCLKQDLITVNDAYKKQGRKLSWQTAWGNIKLGLGFGLSIYIGTKIF